MVGQNLTPPGWNRVKESENLGATTVASVAPAVKSLLSDSQEVAQALFSFWGPSYYIKVKFIY